MQRVHPPSAPSGRSPCCKAGSHGSRYGLLEVDPFPALPLVAYAVGILVLVQIVIGLAMLARRYRAGLLMLARAALLVAIDVKCSGEEN
jgi:hypothetical protein